MTRSDYADRRLVTAALHDFSSIDTQIDAQQVKPPEESADRYRYPGKRIAEVTRKY